MQLLRSLLAHHGFLKAGAHLHCSMKSRQEPNSHTTPSLINPHACSSRSHNYDSSVRRQPRAKELLPVCGDQPKFLSIIMELSNGAEREQPSRHVWSCASLPGHTRLFLDLQSPLITLPKSPGKEGRTMPRVRLRTRLPLSMFVTRRFLFSSGRAENSQC